VASDRAFTCAASTLNVPNLANLARHLARRSRPHPAPAASSSGTVHVIVDWLKAADRGGVRKGL